MNFSAKIFYVGSALLVSTAGAYADGVDAQSCSDCQTAYTNRISVCASGDFTDEGQTLCYSTAQSNLNSCTNNCSYSNDDD